MDEQSSEENSQETAKAFRIERVISSYMTRSPEPLPLHSFSKEIPPPKTKNRERHCFVMSEAN
jgi:hypothetical protein